MFVLLLSSQQSHWLAMENTMNDMRIMPSQRKESALGPHQLHVLNVLRAFVEIEIESGRANLQRHQSCCYSERAWRNNTHC